MPGRGRRRAGPRRGRGAGKAGNRNLQFRNSTYYYGSSFAQDANSNLDSKELQKDGCSYCGQRLANTLVKCAEDCCQRWFCNGSYNNEPGNSQKESHIITHLRASQHRRIAVNQVVEKNQRHLFHFCCSDCQDDDCFDLGMQTKTVFFYLANYFCRQCAVKRKIFATRDKWTPLVDCHHSGLKCISEYIVKVPSDEDQWHCKRMTRPAIAILERSWLLETNGLSMWNQDENTEIPIDTFPTVKEYRNHFEKLVKLEYLLDGTDTKIIPVLEKILITRFDTNIPIRWIEFETKSHIHKRVLERGQPVEVKTERNDSNLISTASGTVKYNHETGNVMTICVNFPSPTLQRDDLKGAVSVEVVFQDIMYKRQLQALNRFGDSLSIHDRIKAFILGDPMDAHLSELSRTNQNHQGFPQALTVPGLALNQSQEQAVRLALTSPLSLVQGPPGTGKTHTIVAIVCNILRNHHNTKVLCCAPSNDATDHLAVQLAGSGLHFVVTRINSKRTETDSPPKEVADLTLRNKLEKLLGKDYENKFSASIVADRTNNIISKSHVICTTCNTAASRDLAHWTFKYVIIDEATQATETDTLIPATKGCEKLVLIGDEKQLGVVNKFRELENTNLGWSLFERLIHLGQVPSVMLDTQYRMHPLICEPASNVIYDGLLKTGSNVAALCESRVLSFLQPTPQRYSPILMVDTAKFHEMAADGKSLLNGHEAVVVTLCLVNLLHRKVRLEDVGVITFYNGQKDHLKSNTNAHGCVPKPFQNRVMIDSVDAFQGREKKFIILSCVRSGNVKNTSIGFLNDQRRLNVALTRAKEGVIIVGNRSLLEKSRVWREILAFYPKVDEKSALRALGTSSFTTLNCKYCDNLTKRTPIQSDTSTLAYSTVPANSAWQIPPAILRPNAASVQSTLLPATPVRRRVVEQPERRLLLPVAPIQRSVLENATTESNVGPQSNTNRSKSSTRRKKLCCSIS